VTARFLLDTSTVSSPISKSPSAEIVKRLSAVGHECAIAAPVWHELSYGCARIPAGKRRDAIAQYLEDVVLASFPVLPYDEGAARWQAHERARLDALGKPAPFVDGQIAAIAFTNGLILVTSNVKDFARYRGLTVENWSRRRG
jgi:tRNA(fMet)-specific endonuclease VapC